MSGIKTRKCETLWSGHMSGLLLVLRKNIQLLRITSKVRVKQAAGLGEQPGKLPLRYVLN